MPNARRISVVTSELLGIFRNGGIGTAMSLLSLALARCGHNVEVVYAGPPAEAISSPWRELYERWNVIVRPLSELEEHVEPPDMRLGRRVVKALREATPDLVVAQDWQGPAAQAITLRRADADFHETRFVTFCHSTSAWLAEVSGKSRRSAEAVAVELAERTGIAYADTLVSPSLFMLEWLREREWQLPVDSRVIPYLTPGTALGDDTDAWSSDISPAPLRRIAFFGRLGDAKGLRVFLDALEIADPGVFEGIEVLFLGSETKTWRADSVRAALPRHFAERAAVRVETQLDQPEALALLQQPGTLAIMPSLGENSPYVVYECLERRIPFLASTRGGAAELIAADDRSHALTDPEPDQIATALERARCQGVSPVRAAFAAEASLESWRAIVEADVPVREGSRSRRMNVDVVETPGTLATSAEWVLLLPAGVAPSVNLVDTLARAQEATGADVVTCGIDIASDAVTFLFQGDAGGLGVLANRFGTVALLRRQLLRDEHVTGASADPVWPLLAELSMAGATIVSVPEPLAIAAAAPGDLRSAPADGAAVARLYERSLGGAFTGLALLATVGASADGASSASPGVRGAYRTLGRAMASTVGRGARRLAG